jgi:hypothetical protein
MDSLSAGIATFLSKGPRRSSVQPRQLLLLTHSRVIDFRGMPDRLAMESVIEIAWSTHVEERIRLNIRLGSDNGHAERQGAEQRLIRQMRRNLGER